MCHLVVPLLVILITISWSTICIASKNCAIDSVSKLVSLEGKLFFDADGKGNWQAAHLNDTVCEGARVRVEPYSRASLLLPNGIVLRLDEGTVLLLNDIAPHKPTLLGLLKGFVYFISRTPRHLEITTPIANAGPEGTEFAMSVDGDKASLWVYEGAVKFFNSQGSLHLKPGDGALALIGQAPQAYIGIRPQDAVNWALYYPPLLPYPEASALVDADIRAAINDFRQGHVNEALLRLDALPIGKQSRYFFKVRGAIRLTAGRVKLALQDIHVLQTNNPNDAEALALKSVLALTQNRKEEALALANEAISADSRSATAYSALAYAEQGRFELDKALAAADQAVKLAPHDAMVWARKAELELAIGKTADSKASAQQALKLDADLERTQTVMGFACLLHMDTDAAFQAFAKALALDATSPLARLGLGLAKIRNGDLMAGRQDLEIAAMLNPNNSLIRSYLGKAYYEEKRNDLAEDQFSLAKARDPKDPTPYFYDALKKQTENRPVEALQDLQKSTALNDNRAVYRSKQLLDQDRAVRGTSIARIFNTLGLEKRAIVEASKSLSIDPSDASSHRFLSDAYIHLPRQGIAQVSELLQAQLLQPININPVQPHLSVNGLGSISGIGPAEAGFKDFTPTFDRNQPQLITSGLIGNNQSYADEAVLSGIFKKLSYSFGQFHYETDGFRPNSDINQNIYDGFVQAALTDKLNVQFEYRNQQVEQGDQTLSFEEATLPVREKLDHETIRGGLHLTVTPNSDLVASLIHSERKEGVVTKNPTLVDFTTDTRDGYSGELQYIGRHRQANILIGGGAYSFDGRYNITYVRINPDSFICQFFPSACKDPAPLNYYPDFTGHNVYSYTNFKVTDKLTGTLGISYDDYWRTKPHVDISRINPKVGLQWDVSEHIRLRTAYFQTLKRLLAADQTVEPTQVAGFNQFYDDFNGTTADFFGVAVDSRASNDFYGGFEFNHRKLKQLNVTTGRPDQIQNHLEERYKAYLFWSPISRLALNMEFQRERQSGDLLKIRTDTLPLSIKYFDPSGFYAEAKTTFVWQKQLEGNLQEEFLIVDGLIGYRLPKRMGILSLEARNIFNRHFKYQDISDISSDKFSVQRPFLPERTFFARLTINF